MSNSKCLGGNALGPGKAEGCFRPTVGIDLDDTAPAFDQALDDGQAHATALNLVARLQRLKNRKDARVIGRVDAGADVGPGELNPRALIGR